MSIELTLKQTQEIVEFFGGDEESTVTVGPWPSEKPVPGLWVWCTDYPEEGGIPLDDEACKYSDEHESEP